MNFRFGPAHHTERHPGRCGRHYIFTFHGIGTPSDTVSADESDVWVSQSTFQNILDRIALCENCSVTFDDGNLSDLQTAVPELLERKLRAEFFVVVDRIGAAGYLSRSDLEEMIGTGMAIGSHGMRHVPWRQLDARELHREVAESKCRLEQLLGIPIQHAACPFGSYNRRVLRELHRAGYEHVYTSDRGPAHGPSWLRPRNTVHADDRSEIVDVIMQPLGVCANAMRNLRLAIKRLR